MEEALGGNCKRSKINSMKKNCKIFCLILKVYRNKFKGSLSVGGFVELVK
jgi:hypothetical protein